MSRAFFADLAEAVRSLVDPDLREFSHRASPINLKIWFGDATREHYEAQVMNPRAVEGAGYDPAVPIMEIGLHLEHSKAAANDEVLDHLAGDEKAWRQILGSDAVAGPFLAGPERWRRVSEVWNEPGIVDLDAVPEVAHRLATYVTALEPRRVAPR